LKAGKEEAGKAAEVGLGWVAREAAVEEGAAGLGWAALGAADEAPAEAAGSGWVVAMGSG